MRKTIALLLMLGYGYGSVGILHRGSADVMLQDSLFDRALMERTIRVKQAINPYWRQRPPLFTVPAFKNGLGGSKGDTVVIRILAIRVDFPLEDPDDPATTGNGKFRLTDNGRNPILRVDANGDTVFNPLYDPPHDKRYFEHLLEYVADYYRNVTYGKVKVEFVVIPQEDDSAYHLPHSIRYYGDTSNWIYGLASIIRDAFKVADRDVNLPFTFTDLDGNGVKDAMEGVLDRYVIFHAGSAWQTDIMNNTPFDIPAVYVPPAVMEYAFGRPFIVLNEGADTVWDAAVMPEQMTQDGVESRLQATLVHESMHNFFSAPDLYDVSYHGAGIGAWGIMATGGYLSYESPDGDTIPEGLIAPLPCAFMRWWASWVVDLIWGQGGTLGNEFQTVQPSADFDTLSVYPSAVLTDSSGNFLEDPHGRPRFYKIPINDHEYYLLEYRQKDLNGDSTVKGLWRDGVFVSFFGENDYLLPGKGLLIWHIDENILWDNYAYNEIQVPRPMAVDLEEADHVQDLESFMPPDMHPYQYVWFGCPYDPYFEGNNTEFSDTSRPSSLDNEGGHTGIKIFDISRPESLMTFVLGYQNSISGFPILLIPEHQTIDSGRTFLRYRSNSIVSTYLKYDSLSDIIWAVADVVVDTVRENFINGSVDTLSHFREIDIFAVDGQGNVVASSKMANAGFTYGIALSDIDGDSAMELIFGTTNQKLYALALENNSIISRWFRPAPSPDAIMVAPVVTNSAIFVGNENQELAKYELNGAVGSSIFFGTPVRTSPAFADGKLWFLSTDGRFFKIDPDGFTVMDSALNELVIESKLPPAASNLKDDGKLYVAVARVDSELVVLDSSLSVVWHRALSGVPIAGPAVGDIDGDGRGEVVVLTDKKLFAFNHNGSLMSGFPINIETDTIRDAGAIVLADVNGDGKPDILFQNGRKGIQAYDYHGKPVDGYPLQLAGDADFIAANVVSSTDNTELIAFDSKGYLRGYQLDGSEVAWSQFGADERNNSFVEIQGDSSNGNGTGIDRVYFYPNPTHDGMVRLRFNAQEPGHVSVLLVTQSGLIIGQYGPFDVEGGGYEEVPLDLSSMASGLYIVRVKFDLESGTYIRFLKLAIER